MGIVPEAVPMLERTYGVSNGHFVEGKDVTRWFYHAQAPSGEKVGHATGDRGVPGYDMTLRAPKGPSVLWGLSDDAGVRAAVDAAHKNAVAAALQYLELHPGYTPRADPANPKCVSVFQRSGCIWVLNRS